MLKNYVCITFRNLQKQKSYSFINIFGLAVGLSVCMLISLWVIDELNYDQFHTNKDNLYRVIVEQKDVSGEYYSAITQFPLATALKSEIPEVINSARFYPGDSPHTVKYQDRISKINNVGFADKSFLEMFSYELESGDRATALDNPNSIILSKAEAQNYFGDVNPIGKLLAIDYFGTQKEFMVTGVLKDEQINSHLSFDALIPFHIFNPLYDGVNGWERASNYFTYVQTVKNASTIQLTEKISNFLTKYIPENKDKLLLQRLTDIHLTTDIKFDSPSNVNISYIHFFSLIAIFVILIACINFMNLSTARAEKRAKEIGLRKVVGAQRSQIIAQFFGESILYTFLALIISIFLVEICLPVFNTIAGKELVLSALFSSSYIFLFASIIIITALLAGSYPAIILSSFKPADVIRRKTSGSKEGSIFRKGLVIVQFSLSTILIIGMLIVTQQLNFLRNRDLGFDKENVIYLQIPRGTDNFEIMKNDLLNYSEISGIGASNILPVHGNESNFSEWDGNSTNMNVLFNISAVDYDYCSTLGIKLAYGRFFSKEYPNDLTNSCIVNEEAVKQMGMEDPLGKKIHGYTIIGVVKNYNYMSLHNAIEPIFLRCAPQYATYIYAKINPGNFTDAINEIESVYNKYLPDAPFDYHFLDTTIDSLYKVEQQSRALFGGFTFLAIFISSLGLLGLIAFMVEKRTREIGVRKVLGASVSGIIGLLLADFIKLIIMANIIAWPAAYYLMDGWLNDFAFRISMNVWVFAISGIIALTTAVITIAYHAVKAAVANPVNSLKYE